MIKPLDNRGVTLTELLIVVSIIGILIVALGFSFQGWMGGYKVESQVKGMYVDLMNARARAMQSNRMHFVRFSNTTTYTIYEDDYAAAAASKVPNGDGILQEGNSVTSDRQFASYPKTLDYAVTIGTVGGIPPINFNLNGGGLISPERTICIFTDFDGDPAHLSDYDPDSDCIVISQTRINIGKITTQNTGGGTCVSANCVAK